MTDLGKSESIWSPRMLSVLRIMAALLFMEHGTMKLLGFPASPMSIGFQLSLMGIAGILELFGGLMLAVGLFVRPVAFVLSGEMAVAYFMAHAPHGFFPAVNMGEPAVLFCFTFLYLAIAGGGAWSLDRLRARG